MNRSSLKSILFKLVKIIINPWKVALKDFFDEKYPKRDLFILGFISGMIFCFLQVYFIVRNPINQGSVFSAFINHPEYYLIFSLWGGLLVLNQMMLVTVLIVGLSKIYRTEGIKERAKINISFFLPVGGWGVALIGLLPDRYLPLFYFKLPFWLDGPASFYLRPSHLISFPWVVIVLWNVFRYQLNLSKSISGVLSVAFPLFERFFIEHPNILWWVLIQPTAELLGMNIMYETPLIYLLSQGILFIFFIMIVCLYEKLRKTQSP